MQIATWGGGAFNGIGNITKTTFFRGWVRGEGTMGKALKTVFVLKSFVTALGGHERSEMEN